MEASLETTGSVTAVASLDSSFWPAIQILFAKIYLDVYKLKLAATENLRCA